MLKPDDMRVSYYKKHGNKHIVTPRKTTSFYPESKKRRHHNSPF